MSEKMLPRFQKYEDFAIFNVADDEETIATAKEHIDRTGTETFLAAHPEYHQCDENAKLLEAWLYLHGDLPFTRWNLEVALSDLQSDGLLKAAPPPEQPGVDKWAGITLTRTDALAEYQPADSERQALAKLADDPNLSDAARKARDRKLRLLAGQQRRELTPQNLYR
jgi:hypothetical protein